jgi:crossover junction endodeoxyribonuclease RuvC
MRLIGLDPGLQRTGWGVVEADGTRLRWIASGTLKSDAAGSLATRLAELYRGLATVLERHAPEEAAVEETFLNKNPGSTLKLGHARAVSLLVPALAGLAVHEYSANSIKKSVVGTGHADKEQVACMVRRLLPGFPGDGADATDALAVAICHAHHAQTKKVWTDSLSPLSGARRSFASPSARKGKLRLPERGEGRGEGGQNARRLRADQTDCEKRLWAKLRAGALEGHKFRRQHPIGPYVADFVCLENRIIVELDGGQHNHQSDAKRTAYLQQWGFRVLRYWNNEVSGNLEGVLADIRSALSGPPSPRPSPPEGGERERVAK